MIKLLWAWGYRGDGQGPRDRTDQSGRSRVDRRLGFGEVDVGTSGRIVCSFKYIGLQMVFLASKNPVFY